MAFKNSAFCFSAPLIVFNFGRGTGKSETFLNFCSWVGGGWISSGAGGGCFWVAFLGRFGVGIFYFNAFFDGFTKASVPQADTDNSV